MAKGAASAVAPHRPDLPCARPARSERDIDRPLRPDRVGGYGGHSAWRWKSDWGGALSLSPQEWTAVGVSLKVATAGALASVAPALFVAWLLARRRFPAKSLLNAIVHLPIVLPPVVTGWLLLILFGRRDPSAAPSRRAAGSTSPSAGRARRSPRR